MGFSPFFFGINKKMLNKRADKLELLRIAEAVALEKSIDKELIISSMETGIAKAARSKFGQENEIKVLINRDNGDIELFRRLIIAENPENTNTEIKLEDAINLNEINKDKVTNSDSAFKDAEKEVSSKIDSYLTNDGKRTVESLHKDLGQIMWNHCGMSRNQKDLNKALDEIKELKNTFWSDVKVPGKKDTLNAELEKADRVADFIELGDLMIRDALDRNESCGAHFREEYQTDDGEAMRDDKNYSYVSTWENKGDKAEPILHKEKLLFDTVTPTQRSYK